MKSELENSLPYIVFQVANGAGSAYVEPWGGALTGLFGGGVYVICCSVVTKLRIDDPLNATAGKIKIF